MKAKILVVDDDAVNRDILKTRLEASGYEVFEAADGEQGINSAIKLLPDVVIMDLMMPKMDGWLACRVLKSNAKTARIPVIMLTARNQGMEELRGWESGADEYLTKPCDHQRILFVVAGFLARGGVV